MKNKKSQYSIWAPIIRNKIKKEEEIKGRKLNPKERKKFIRNEKKKCRRKATIIAVLASLGITAGAKGVKLLEAPKENKVNVETQTKTDDKRRDFIEKNKVDVTLTITPEEEKLEAKDILAEHGYNIDDDKIGCIKSKPQFITINENQEYVDDYKENTEAKTLRSSNDVTKTVTIKANQAPYNYVTRTQAVSLAEGFSTKQGYKAKTKLVSSYAWDTTIAFIEKTVNNYGSSSPQGNYLDTSVTYKDITDENKSEKTKAENSSLLVATGQTTPVCNIYDMGGNIYEWTTESYSTTIIPYAVRGGTYYDGFARYPAGHRNGSSGNANEHDGFRLTLFM